MWLERVEMEERTYCLGAVVLTLKAMGASVGLDRRRIWETSWVKGPIVGYVSRVLVASWLHGAGGWQTGGTYA